MLYKIIKTQSSSDELISYSLFRHHAEADDLRAETYGIIAVDRYKSNTVNDVTTDIFTAERLMAELSDNSVRVDSIVDCIIDYLSEL